MPYLPACRAGAPNAERARNTEQKLIRVTLTKRLFSAPKLCNTDDVKSLFVVRICIGKFEARVNLNFFSFKYTCFFLDVSYKICKSGVSSYKDIQTLHICIEMKPRHNVFVNTCQNKGHNFF